MNTINGQLDAIYCRVATDRRIVFGYRKQRRQIFESIRPWDIREALQIGLKTIEEAFPGALAKASALDDDDWLSSRSRTRRYIAESPDLVYIDSPHLLAQVEAVCGYYVPTNIPWRDVPGILRLACKAAGIKPIRIYPGSPWENGYNERFNGTLRREVLNTEWFTSIRQARIVIEAWLKQYNHVRPHQALNMRPPMPETLSGSGT